MRKEKYPTDLTDSQWAIIEPLFSGMRNRKWSKRELVNAVLYLVKTGCQWRQLPHDFPPYSTVHSFYRRARLSGLWDRILEHLVELTRENAGRNPSPSVKTTTRNELRGYDGGKKRKDENES